MSSWSRLWLACLGFVLVSVSRVGSASAVGVAQTPAAPIVVIVMENKTYGEIVGNSNAPYIQSMIANGTLYTNYQAARGSLPDYLAMTSGVNTTSAASGSNNLFHELQSASASWGEFMESMPRACYTGSGSFPYDASHNPAVHYKDITSNAAACKKVVPYTSFNPAALPAFSYVVPNDTDNMHTGSSHTAEIKAGDAWLSANVPAMLNAGARVILTWDEGTSGNEHIATIAIGGGAAAGATDNGAYTHYGLLAGLEDAFGVKLLHGATIANPFPVS